MNKSSKIEVRMEILEKELTKIQCESKKLNMSEYVRELIYKDLIESGLLSPRENED